MIPTYLDYNGNQALVRQSREREHIVRLEGQELSLVV